MEKKEPTWRLVFFLTLLPLGILWLFLFQQPSPFFFNRNYFGNRAQSSMTEAELSVINQRLRRLVREEDLPKFEVQNFTCDVDNNTEICIINKPIIFDKKSLTIYIPNENQTEPITRMVKPYPRREDQSAMNIVAPVRLLIGKSDSIRAPGCQFEHRVPALMFSFAGFIDNIFHAFNEIVIPSFLTSNHFDGEVQFVYTEYRPRWGWKYISVVHKLSKFDPILADDPTLGVHCFPAAAVGLRYHDNLGVSINQVPKGYTMSNVRQFLWNTFNTKVKTKLNLQKPKLLLLSRQKSRVILNEDELVTMMEHDLGLYVYRARPNMTSNLAHFAQIVNSCEIMVGAHGAGLTNDLFLPDGAVMIQIVPLGLNWASDHYYGGPAPGIGLKYLRYKVLRNESSLYETYGPNDPVIMDPSSIWAKGYGVVKEVYLDSQNFRINLSRFKDTLIEALKLLERSKSL